MFVRTLSLFAQFHDSFCLKFQQPTCQIFKPIPVSLSAPFLTYSTPSWYWNFLPLPQHPTRQPRLCLSEGEGCQSWLLSKSGFSCMGRPLKMRLTAKMLSYNWNNSNPKPETVFPQMKKPEQWIQVSQKVNLIPNWKAWMKDYCFMLKYPLSHKCIHVLWYILDRSTNPNLYYEFFLHYMFLFIPCVHLVFIKHF